MDTNGCQVSDLEDIEFLWDDPYLNMDADYRPGLNTPFAFPFLTILRKVQWLKT